MARIFSATLLWLATLGSGWAACSADQTDLRGPWGRAAFQTEVADTDATRSQGLMDRAALPASAGMLFVYETPRAVAFWMRNTLIPLDMIFADATGRVTRIHENAVPLDETPIPGGDSVQFVLEIKGGMAGLLGVTEGSELRHPAIAPDTAIWPCR